MNDQSSVLALVTTRLDAAGIAYMVTGSIAAGYYAHPRMTRDIDLVVALQANDAERLAALFSDQFECEADSMRRAIARESLFNLIHTASIVKVDFIVLKRTAYRQEEFTRRRQVLLDGQPLWIAAPEDLMLSKLVWAKDSRSELQMKDVRHIIAAQPTLDWVYLEKWAPQLDVGDLLREVRP